MIYLNSLSTEVAINYLYWNTSRSASLGVNDSSTLFVWANQDAISSSYIICQRMMTNQPIA